MPTVRVKAIRLTPPQVELLTDIATNPQMFIRCWSRWDRTTQVLERKGLAARVPGYSGSAQYEIRITEQGRAEAVRRGIIAVPVEEKGGESGESTLSP